MPTRMESATLPSEKQGAFFGSTRLFEIEESESAIMRPPGLVSR